MTTTEVLVLTGLPGCGKTTTMLDEMASAPGRYLFSMPRKALINERVRDLYARTHALAIKPTVIPIHSDQGSKANVGRRIRDVAAEVQHEGHVIVLIAHEALASTDLSDFTGWHARLDEDPDAVASGQFTIPVAARWFSTLYDLEPVAGTKWAKVVPLPSGPTLGAFMQDDFAKEVVGFHKRVLSPAGVLVDACAWDDIYDTQRPVRWWSAWTPGDLAHFASIKIASSGYFSSLGYLAAKAWAPDAIDFKREVVEVVRTGSPEVRVHYYTRAHRGSTEFWKGGQGAGCLAKVGRHLATVQDLGFWSGNETVQERFRLLLNGERVAPKQAGTNAYRHLTSCAMIYSSKAQDSDAAILQVFGLSKGQVERARETEDLQQFVMRGAIRNPDFSGRYDVYLYDLVQAEAVRDFLIANGITDVELLGLDQVGIMDAERPKPGRKRDVLDQTTKAQRDAERRLKDKQRKKNARALARDEKRKAGTDRKRGRPRKRSVVQAFVTSGSGRKSTRIVFRSADQTPWQSIDD